MGCCGNNRPTDEGVEMTGQKSGGNNNGKRQYDPSFSGPIKNRSCTDIPCCLLFILYVAGMLIVGVLAFIWGNPMTLFNPTDSQGNVCGKTEKVKSKPNLFYFDLTECVPTDLSPSKILSTVTNCPTYTICVEKCPSENTAALTASKDKLNCKYSYDTSQWDTSSYSTKYDVIFKNKSCASYTLQSSAVISRCIPTVIGTTLSNFLSTNQQNITGSGRNITEKDVQNGNIAAAALLNLQNLGKKVIQDVETSWYWILAVVLARNVRLGP